MTWSAWTKRPPLTSTLFRAPKRRAAWAKPASPASPPQSATQSSAPRGNASAACRSQISWYRRSPPHLQNRPAVSWLENVSGCLARRRDSRLPLSKSINLR
jgi:hypothetical protein